VDTEEFPAVDSLLSGEEFLPVGGVFGSISRGGVEEESRGLDRVGF
jgi:hypothetical protein